MVRWRQGTGGGRRCAAANVAPSHPGRTYLRAHPVAANLLEEIEADEKGRFSIPGFTRADEDVVLYVSAPDAGDDPVSCEATPRAGPVEIRIPRRP